MHYCLSCHRHTCASTKGFKVNLFLLCSYCKFITALEMADIFNSQDAANLLRGRKVYFIGDSNMRALYKDTVCLLNHDRLLTNKQLKEKAEKCFLGDTLLRGSALTKGRDYREDRRFKRGNEIHVEFHFVTKCYNEDVEGMMRDIRNRRIKAPDIIVINSTFWDIQRWGPKGVELFKDNMISLMRLFKASLPPSTLVIWVTAPPASVEIRGGFLIHQLEFAKFSMRFHVMEANLFAQQLVSQSGYNVLDFHFHLRMQVHWRAHDGLHWTEKAMRHLTNLLFTHISLALNVPLPGNFSSALLTKHKALAVDDSQDLAVDVELPQVPKSLQPPSEFYEPVQPRENELYHRRKNRARQRLPPSRWEQPCVPHPPPPSYAPPQQAHQQDFTSDYSGDGSFLEYPSETQQIQSHWGPVRRTPRQMQRRHYPY